MSWYNSFPSQSKRLVVYYDDLVSNLEHELRRIMTFLNVSVDDDVMTCVLHRREGHWHRQKKKKHVGVVDDVFDVEMRRNLTNFKHEVYKALQKE